MVQFLVCCCVLEISWNKRLDLTVSNCLQLRYYLHLVCVCVSIEGVVLAEYCRKHKVRMTLRMGGARVRIRRKIGGECKSLCGIIEKKKKTAERQIRRAHFKQRRDRNKKKMWRSFAMAKAVPLIVISRQMTLRSRF